MYREVTMMELKEVLRLRGEGVPKKRLAAQLGLDPKTVRRYLTVAAAVGVPVGATPVTDEHLTGWRAHRGCTRRERATVSGLDTVSASSGFGTAAKCRRDTWR